MGSYIWTDNPMIKFDEMCKNANTGEEICQLVDYYYEITKNSDFELKSLYNNYIGWALPSIKTCNLVVETWKLYPNSHIVDLGAGTGVFCKVFNDMGIQENKLLAIDLIKPSHCSKHSRSFWPIYRYDNYKVDSNDILFIAWGLNFEYIVDDYVKRGGHCVIILGELGGGLTFPPDFFLDDNDQPKDGWDVVLHKARSPLLSCCERLSINRRIKYP